MRLRRVSAGLLLIAAARVSAQASGTVVVRVTDRLSGLPLTNAEVIDRSNGRSRMTDLSGTAYLDWRGDGQISLRVRQVGYQFSDTVIARSDSAVSLAVPLSRIAYTLPPVPVSMRDDCDFGADTANAQVAAVALEQLRVGAERYDTFRRQYPFQVRVERRTREFTSDGTVARDVVKTEVTGSDRWGERYAPGRVLSRGQSGFSVPILFLPNLADPTFWKGHCFAVRGIETASGRRVVRLAFWPSRELRTPDWEGSALLDSATSELRRVEFRLVNLDRRAYPRRLEGFTTFRSPSPFVVLPDSTAAIWWRSEPQAGSTVPDVLQVLHVQELTYRSMAPVR